MRYFYVGFIVLFLGCSSADRYVLDDQITTHQLPRLVPLNTHGGYTINPFSGDSIKPIINSLGDTVKTGEPVKARGRVIDPGSVENPRIVPAGDPIIVPVHLYLNNLPGAFPLINLDNSTLNKIALNLDPSFFTRKEINGETEIMEVSAPAQCIPVATSQPKPLKALPPMMK